MNNVLRISAMLAAFAMAQVQSLHAANSPIIPSRSSCRSRPAARPTLPRASSRKNFLSGSADSFLSRISAAPGAISHGQWARAPADGYTILAASSSIVVNPSRTDGAIRRRQGFIPITKLGASPNGWLVSHDFPAKTMKDLIDLMKANPGKYSVGTPGTGTTPSLAVELLKQGYGVDFVTVPFAGGGPVTQSLLGGFTPIACAAMSNVVALIKGDKIRALALTTRDRLETLADVPTLTELGIKDQESETMAGAFVPAGTPQPIVELLQKEIAAIVHLPDVRARMLELGTVPDGDSSADFAAYVKAEIAKWKKVIEVGKIDRI